MSSSVRLCLIDVVKTDNWITSDLRLNLIMLASYLTKNKILSPDDIRIINCTYESPVKVITAFKPSLIGLSVMTPFYEKALKLARKIKSVSNAPLVIGGYHISGAPYSLDKIFDVGVIGEGEGALSDLIKLIIKEKFSKESFKKIKNLVYWKDGNLVISDRRPLISAEKIPEIDWNLVPPEQEFSYESVLKEEKPILVKSAPIFTARGCPYNCTFCAHQVLWPGGSGLRFFPAKRVGKEIEFLYKHKGVNCINIYDDTFAVSKNRLKELIDELSKRKLLGKVYFDTLFIRANLVDEEFVRLLKKFGTLSVFIGIESGSIEVLDYLKCGSLKPKDVKRAVRLFNKYNISVIGAFMFFSPGEKSKDVGKTLALAKWFANQPSAFAIRYSVTTPYPGTKLWDRAVKEKVIDVNNPNWSDYVMYNLLPSSVSPLIFFKGSFTDKERLSYWKRIVQISEELHKKVTKCSDWVETGKIANSKNLELLKIFEARNIQLSLYSKLIMLMRHPLESIKKIKKKPIIVAYTYKEVKEYLHRVYK